MLKRFSLLGGGLLALFLLAVPVLSFAQDSDKALNGPDLQKSKDHYAVLNTTKGLIIVQLFKDQAPIAVRNFVNLAEGSKPWRDPESGQPVKRRFYDGLTFHRVIPGFMIQGGDPIGNGRGGPGYAFQDETSPDLSFDRDYMLAMANSGPETNGSQFFITDKQSTPTHLNGRHTILGRVVDGFEVVSEIAKVPTNETDKPVEDVVIVYVQIIRIPSGQKVEDKPWATLVQDVPKTGPSSSKALPKPQNRTRITTFETLDGGDQLLPAGERRERRLGKTKEVESGS